MSSKLQRLFVKSKLAGGGEITLAKDQAHYLANVLRLKQGERLLLFNGRDGEWCGALRAVGKRGAKVMLEHQTRAQEDGPDLHYLFAPLKRARLDYMAQKATEMGAAALRPVITRHTVAERVKTDRLLANAIEAAEQCNRTTVPAIAAPQSLESFLEIHDGRTLYFADEGGGEPAASTFRSGPSTILTGPEGGFTEEERATIRSEPNAIAISLGPRILRAETAALAAITTYMALAGDWR